MNVQSSSTPSSSVESKAASTGYVLGVDIGGSNIRLALAGLDGRIINRTATSLGENVSPAAVVELLRQGLDRLCLEASILKSAVLAIVAGAPGITDVHTGRVVSAPNLKDWSDVPLSQIIEASTGIPAGVDNDVNLAAVGERWYGSAIDVDNFVFLAIGTGIGAGLFVNGALHYGASFLAGEVGYMLLPGTPVNPLRFDKLGAFESVVSGRAIETAWEAIAQQYGKPANLKASEIFDLAATGDPQASLLLENTAMCLAAAVVNIGLILDTSLFVLGGGLGTHAGLLAAANRVLDQNEFPRARLVPSTLGSDAQLYGAIQLALQAVRARIR